MQIEFLIDAALQDARAARFADAEAKLLLVLEQDLSEQDTAKVKSLLGAVYAAAGNHQAAVKELTEAAVNITSDATIFSNLCNSLRETEQLEEAISAGRKALAIRPDYADAYNNLGNALNDFGKHDEAIASYRSALNIEPDNAETTNNLGVALDQFGNPDEAIACFTRALQINSDYAEAHYNLGNTLNHLGKHDAAITSYQNALQIEPDNAEMNIKLGVALDQFGKPDEAIACYTRALQINSDYVEAHNNLGNALNHLGKPDEAIACYTKALQINSDYVEAHYNLGNTFEKLRKYDEAIAGYAQALQIKPDYAEAHNNLGNTLTTIGNYDEAIASYTRALQIKPDFAEAQSNRNFALNYSSDWSVNTVFERHLEFEKIFGGLEPRTALKAPARKKAGERLKIGYVSPDFRTHSVAHFFEPLIRAHDKRTVEIFCYYNDKIEDETTNRLMKESEHWRSIVGISDKDVVDLIKKDEIDILVDLAGHTANNRLTVFARKPAPVQVTWLGYPNTTGLSAIDYRFTDIVADPVGEADEYHTEELIRLPNGFLCYRGDETVSANAELPFEMRGHITFGSFNNLTKVTPQVVLTWARILHELPTSHILLKSKQLEDPSVRSRYLELFKEKGISEDRIELQAYLPSNNDHLALYDTIDICVDPFPYNGTTTTCEALWMGVPVITLVGDRHAGRVGASILANVGLADCITEDLDGYIKTAVQMAKNTDYLKEVRLGLREKLQNSSLFDEIGFARDIERSYQSMWDDYTDRASIPMT